MCTVMDGGQCGQCGRRVAALGQSSPGQHWCVAAAAIPLPSPRAPWVCHGQGGRSVWAHRVGPVPALVATHRWHGLSKRRPRSLEAAVTFLCCQPGMELISLHPGCDCDWNKGTKAIWSASPGGDRASLPAARTRTQESLIWSHSVIPNLTLSQQP